MAIAGKQDEYFDELEVMPPATREKYLNQKLSETVDHAYCHAPVVKDIFDKVGFRVIIRKRKSLFWNYLFIYGIKSEDEIPFA